MKRLSIVALLLLGSTGFAADSLDSWFKEGKGYGNIKYYYIETNKDYLDGTDSSAHANSIGGQLGYKTGKWNGVSAAITMMTTNPFWLPGKVDTSIIGRDNGLTGGNPEKGFAVVGEAYLDYSKNDWSLSYGRKVIKTPLINAKEVRMLPSAVEGAFANMKLEYGTKIEAAYLQRFKQRTSDNFMNIVKHALGDLTKDITGSDTGNVAMLGAIYSKKNYTLKIYDYYSKDFINSVYLQSDFKNSLSNGISYKASFQYIGQRSIGNADDNLAIAGSVTGGKDINTDAFGAKVALTQEESTLSLAYTKVLKDENSHDSLVLPWDGTPLFTNMITANNLFQSNYGKALKSDSAYIGGTQGVRVGYTQGFDFTGVKGFKTTIAYALFTNGRFPESQRDINAVISYSKNNYSIALKGIWVDNPTSAAADGTVSQIDSMAQYRVIANYKF
ncbi:OprD family outer membrane porin [Nitrosophilus alvini]|uniref:OprD family outer membrane porin n=1 Tax=Nitrosophilus alvini TaxID=2714855 RepID=UPI0019099FEA|nr:OprD family outer membrane porin [Nitrosophilus alvini]